MSQKGDYKIGGKRVYCNTLPNCEIIPIRFENSNQIDSISMQVVERINKSFGQQKNNLAGQDLKRVWKMKRKKLSPKKTTRLDKVIVVRV